MAKKMGTRIGILAILLIAGALFGSIIWSLLEPVLPDFLNANFAIGSTSGPWNLDLHFIQVAFGLVFRFNIGGVIGMIALAAGFYKKWAK